MMGIPRGRPTVDCTQNGYETEEEGQRGHRRTPSCGDVRLGLTLRVTPVHSVRLGRPMRVIPVHYVSVPNDNKTMVMIKLSHTTSHIHARH